MMRMNDYTRVKVCLDRTRSERPEDFDKVREITFGDIVRRLLNDGSLRHDPTAKGFNVETCSCVQDSKNSLSLEIQIRPVTGIDRIRYSEAEWYLYSISMFFQRQRSRFGTTDIWYYSHEGVYVDPILLETLSASFPRA